jgi:hypothetical protein
MKKKGDFPFFYFLFPFLGLVLFFGYQVWRFFTKPDALEQLMETVKAFGICFGIILFVLLLVLLLVLLFPPSSREAPKTSVTKKEYLVKSFPTLMEWRDVTSYSKSLHRVENQAISPVYIIVSVDNYGLYISNIPSDFKLDFVSQESNKEQYYLLSNNSSNPITIITPHYEIYYFLFSERGDFKTEWRPTNMSGYSGSLPQNINQNSVEIVIVYGSIEDPNNKLQPIYRDPPLELGLIALNSKGEYDLAATCELYNTILAAKNSSYASEDGY